MRYTGIIQNKQFKCDSLSALDNFYSINEGRRVLMSLSFYSQGRTIDQNKLLRLWLRTIEEDNGTDMEILLKLFKSRCLLEDVSTSDMTDTDINLLLRECEKEADRLQIFLPFKGDIK